MRYVVKMASYRDLVYDILVEDGGASEEMRDAFKQGFLRMEEYREWRFQGHFGFGGKLYRDIGRWRVDYYIEDRTPQLDALRERMNDKLEDLLSLYEG